MRVVTFGAQVVWANSMSKFGWAGMGLILFALMGENAYSQGVIISSAGPVHRGMGGASTAAPVTALGALYWNPATISGIQGSELEVGIDVLFTQHEVSSTVGPFSDTTEADPGTFPVPNFGFVHRIEDSRWSLGLGVNSVGGFKTNLTSSSTNPVLMPQPNGLGQVSSEASFLQIAPVACFEATERLSIAAGPIITTAQVGMQPFVFASANGDSTYSDGRATRYHWGGGAQAGLFYLLSDNWNLGASIKSTAWMETFEFDGVDENGLPRDLTAKIDLPMIVSMGAGYLGWEDWLLAADLRFIDYSNADGFGDRATYDGTGKLNGLDWSSVFAFAFGAQKAVTDRAFVRVGYSYNQNPIRNSESFYNVATPLIYEHILSCGGSFKLNEKLAISAAYSHYFENTRTGLVSPPTGAIVGSSVTNTVSADFLSFGIVMQQ